MANYNLTQTGAEVQAILDSVATIDAAPTENSPNPVQSGGVFSAIQTDATPTENSTKPVQSGGVYDGLMYKIYNPLAGMTLGNTSYDPIIAKTLKGFWIEVWNPSAPIPTTLKFILYRNNASQGVFFQIGDASNVTILWSSSSSTKLTGSTEFVVEGYSSMRGKACIHLILDFTDYPGDINFSANFTTTTFVSAETNRSANGSTESVKEKVTEISPLLQPILGAKIENVYYKNLFDSSKIVTGFGLNGNTGMPQKYVDTAFFICGIDLGIGDTITLSGLPSGGTGARYYAIWDAEGNVLVKDAWQQTTSARTLHLPDNAAFVLFDVYRANTNPDLSQLQIEYGATATTYVNGLQPTNEITISKNGVSQTLPQGIRSRNISILIFGDSITETDSITANSDASNPYTTAINKWVRSNWPTFVNANNSQYYKVADIRNYAQSGASFLDRENKENERQYIGYQVAEAIADLNAPSGAVYYDTPFNPDIIIISAGTNDGYDNSTYETAMAKTITAGSGSTLHLDYSATLANLSPTTSLCEAVRYSFMKIRNQFPNALCFYALPIQRCLREISEPLMENIAKLAKRYNFIVIDTYAESGIVRDFQINDGSYGDLYDGLHTNVSGQKKMARCIMSKVIENIIYKEE